ncbi:hypothetical protein RGRSB_0997 [cyanobacterium endosymbiont of Rhopalodia gibberula]|nr:hypothetical protein RGRSB_0997 [cyanobacterium endosymbiont of Rhopalodia gibberula]
MGYEVLLSDGTAGRRRLKLHEITMGFFDSEVVQQEAKQLFEDYQSLMKLGGEYGKFDREGKKIFIDKMEALMERYKIFMKRFELSEDFMAKITVEQLKTQLGQFGITPQQMFYQMNLTLERMKSEIE